MKPALFVFAAAFAAAGFAQSVTTVVETEKVDPATSAKLQEVKAKVAAENPGLNVVSVEADVVKRIVLAPPPPPPAKTPVMAIFVKNNTKVAGMDDEVDGIRDRLAAEASATGFMIMDSAEIGAAFNRFKVTTAEERQGLISGLFTGGSVTRVAQMLGADYILTASIIGASSVFRSSANANVYTLRMTTKALDATTGGSIYGFNWSEKRPTPASNGDDPMVHYNDLIDMWVADVAQDLKTKSASWPRPAAAAELVSFTVTTTLDDVFTPLATTVDASKPVLEELRVVAGGISVEVDGAAVGTSGGRFMVRPGLHQLKVSRQWMTPWIGTVNIAEGSVFNVALELSPKGFEHYRNKEVLRAELALSYAEAAFRRGCRINFDSQNWQNVTWAPNPQSSAVSSSTVLQPQVVTPIVTSPSDPTVQTPVVNTQPAAANTSTTAP